MSNSPYPPLEKGGEGGFAFGKRRDVFRHKLWRRFAFGLLIIMSYAIMSSSAAHAFPSTKIATIAVGNGPYGIAGNGTYAVVAESQTGYVDLINLSNNLIPPSQHLLIGTNPSMVAVTSDGTTAYVTDYGKNNIYAINLNNSTGFTTSTIPAGSGPLGISIANNTVFFTNYKDNTWAYFPVGSSSPVTLKSWGGGPISIAVNSNGTLTYVANSTSNAVNVFQYNYNGTSTYGVTTTITTGSYPDAVLLTPDQSSLYVANANDNTVSVISTSSNSVVGTIPLPSAGHPDGLAITPDGSTLMVLNSPAGGITYIQVSSNTVINTLALGSTLEQAYMTPNGADAYITDYSASSVYELANVVSISSTKPSAINNSNNNVSIITWSSTMSGTYQIELVGVNGNQGSGTVIPGRGGSISAGQTIATPIYSSDFSLVGGADGPYTIYIYLTTTSLTAYASTTITLLTVPPSPASNLSALPKDSKAILSWTASTSQYIGGYYVYYSPSLFDINSLPPTVVDVKNTTSYTLNGLTDGTLYYIGVIAYDIATNESILSNIASVTPVYIPSPSDLAGQKSNCFIATAAYGSYDDFDVWVLRQFRNRILLKNEAGRWFVQTYYRVSPPLAHFIADHDALRAIVRGMLKPFVFGSMVVLYGTPFQKIMIVLVLIGLILFIPVLMMRRNKYA